MDERIKIAAKDIFTSTLFDILKLYTDHALLLNSYDVTQRSYELRGDDLTLSTTGNIPTPLRLSLELDVQLNRQDLLDQYKHKLPIRFSRAFLVEIVSLIDACLEDIYEIALQVLHPQLTSAEISNRLRSAWSDSGGISAIRRLLVIDLNLLPITGRITTPEMLFDRYEEMRELRHALIHNKGKLSDKHVVRLQTLRGRFPQNAIPGTSTVSEGLLPSGICLDSEVTIGPSQLLSLRKWAFESIGYLQETFSNS